MSFRKAMGQGRLCAFLAIIIFAELFLFPAQNFRSPVVSLNIYDLTTGERYISVPAAPGGKLFFGWTHSLENIAWHEYYHVDQNLELVLDTITVPAFGAGIPADKGRITYVRDGLIYMDEIGERFGQIVWLNSHTATNDIILDGKLVARGRDLPQHRKLKLIIEEE